MSYIELFGALNHSLRFDMVVLLRKRELCICELESILDTKQYQISRHIKILKELNLVTSRKQEKYHYYSLNIKNPYITRLLSFIDDYPDQRVIELNKALIKLADDKIVCGR